MTVRHTVNATWLGDRNAVEPKNTMDFHWNHRSVFPQIEWVVCSSRQVSFLAPSAVAQSISWLQHVCTRYQRRSSNSQSVSDSLQSIGPSDIRRAPPSSNTEQSSSIEAGNSLEDSTDEDSTKAIVISVVVLVVVALLAAFSIYRWRKKRAARAATMRGQWEVIRFGTWWATLPYSCLDSHYPGEFPGMSSQV